MADETSIIIDMTLLLLISGICILIFAKIRMPPILGYLTAGIILGPTMLPELSVDETTVIVLANIGIVFLMFWIGLEQSMAKLKRTGSAIVIVVLIQMTMMVVIGYLVGLALGMPNTQAIFLGAIISGTSTAVVVGVLSANGAITGDQASMIIGITVFEDVGQVIILTLAAPLLAGDTPALGSTVNMVIGLMVFFGLAIMLGMAVLPRLLDHIGNKYSFEILFVITVGLCFTMALISSSLGLSIAIGAFLMGLIVSRSFFSTDMLSKVVPIKELFMAVFFISIGLQIDPELIWENIWLVVIIASTFIFAKVLSVFLACYVSNISARDSFIIATSLVAMGEFAFIISKIALDAGVVTEDFYSAVIGAALITMVALPLLSKVQLRAFNGMVRAIPDGTRSALVRIDGIRANAVSRSEVTKPMRRKVQKEMLIIFLNYLAVIIILLGFQLLTEINEWIMDLAEVYHVLPDLLILFFMFLAIAPAVVNIYRHVRKISDLMTTLVMSSNKYSEKNRNNVRRIFINLGEIAMLVLLAFLLFPFIPQIDALSPIVVVAVLAFSGLVVYLMWDMLRNGYDRFFEAVTGNARPREEEESK